MNEAMTQTFPPITSGMYLWQAVPNQTISANDATGNITAITGGTADFGDVGVKNKIRLLFDESMDTYMSGTHDYQVLIEYTWQTISGASTVNHGPAVCTLYVKYDATNGGVYDDIDEFTLTGAYKLQAKIKRTE